MNNAKEKIYPMPVAVDVVIFTTDGDKLKVLLIRRPKEPFRDFWALPGGFLRPKEATRVAALRVLSEKAGVKDVHVEQLYTFDSSATDPRGDAIMVTYCALVPRHMLELNPNHNTQVPTLFDVDNMPQLAFDHKSIVEYALKRLRNKLEYTNIAFSLLPKKFTFAELQSVYETVFDKKFDKRNFRKKVMALGIIKPLNETLRDKKQRPAELFSFAQEKLIELRKFL